MIAKNSRQAADAVGEPGFQDDPVIIAPVLPPQMDSFQKYTSDELAALINRTPLFMTSLDETDGSGGENIELEALKALAYEGSPAEVAQNFREQGNDCFRSRKWSDARELYTKAILWLRDARSKEAATATGIDANLTRNDTEIDQSELTRERDITEACLANRAACNYELQNYRSVTIDCAACLRLNPRNVKAWYRSGRALIALDKIPEAEDAVQSGLELEPLNTVLLELLEKIGARKSLLQSKQRRLTEQEERKHAEQEAVTAALKARNITTRTTAQQPEMEDARIFLAPDALSPASSQLHFPVVILYPLVLQSDFIKAFSEKDSISSHLPYLFPAPWDVKHEYNPDNVDAYIETITGGLVRSGKKISLATVLGRAMVEVVDSVVRVFIVPKKNATAWINDFKRRKGVAA
ncbi:MAG: hypothetical protein M1829_004434 [Trizodia sp. TS-e1964]|nr:MAG: hypothetical protein M1829_004434 [Trizodia sp. TS-e1964]